MLLAATGVVAGLVLTRRVWRFLVVKKLRWMSDHDVDEFHKRDPGF
jgi:hypothetical protein